ncbi:Transcription factor PRE5 [Spatholobus suberectus]|nr:Transcription factor PRE5 [Spatholobus suberectus]
MRLMILCLGYRVLLPQVNQRGNSRNADKKCLCFGGQQSASEILQETCCHIRRLQKEVEQLSERLSELMDSVDISDIDRRTLQNFLQQ